MPPMLQRRNVENQNKKCRDIRKLFLLTDDVQKNFAEDSIKKNHYSLNVIAALIMIFELFNITRVLFFSRSGLGTLNNRIYFGMYCVLILIGILGILLERWMNRCRQEWLTNLYSAWALVWMIWHVLLNYYDLLGDSNSGMITFVTAMFGISVFIQMKPVHTVVAYLISYLLFLFLTVPILDAGTVVNITFFMIVSMFISLTRYVHTVTEILQRMEIREMNRKLEWEQEALRLSLEKHEIIMRQSKGVIFEWDIAEDCLIFSRNSQEKFRLEGTVRGVDNWILEKSGICEEDKQALIAMLRRCVETRSDGEMELRIKDNSGRFVWYDARIILQYDDSGIPIYGIGVFSDIDERKTQLEWLTTQVQIDSLTGVLNRSAFQQNAEHFLAELPMGETLVMIMLDLDNFKQINDVYGHPKGDYVLEEIARALQKSFGREGLLGRLGGDEFGVILPNAWSRKTLIEKVEQFLYGISLIRIGDGTVRISCSMGIAAAVGSGMTYEMLYENADAALYTAKKSRKGSYDIFEYR